MTKANAEDIWICANCRSVNKARSKQCYKCRTPSALGAVDPTTMAVTGHGQVREVALPKFKASRVRALLASVLILVVAGMQVVSLLVVSSAFEDFVAGRTISEDQFRAMGGVGLASLGIAVVALVGWAAWLSRVVSEMPALGLGYPSTSGFMAFYENLIPFYNLLRVPAIVRDVVRRLDPHPGRAEALIAAAWVGIFGGYAIGRIGGIFLGFTADSELTEVRDAIVVSGISTGFVVIGALFLVWAIWWIEIRIAQRRRAQLASEVAAPPIAPVAAPIAPVTAATGDARWPKVVAPIKSAATPDGSASTPVASLATPIVPEVEARSSGPQPDDVAGSGPSPHLVIRVDADGGLEADLDGETEALTVDGVRALAGALSRAGGSATVHVLVPGATADEAGHGIVDILRDEGVPTAVDA